MGWFLPQPSPLDQPTFSYVMKMFIFSFNILKTGHRASICLHRGYSYIRTLPCKKFFPVPKFGCRSYPVLTHLSESTFPWRKVFFLLSSLCYGFYRKHRRLCKWQMNMASLVSCLQHLMKWDGKWKSTLLFSSNSLWRRGSKAYFPLTKPIWTQPVTGETLCSQLELYVKLGIKARCVCFALSGQYLLAQGYASLNISPQNWKCIQLHTCHLCLQTHI